ncbi:MAG: 2-oxoglutarate dehydrogenase E1 subunit family protein, partial [Methylocella sp.]
MARQDTNGSANGSGGGPGRTAANTAFARTSFLDGANAAYVEQLQNSFQRDPSSLDPSWREFFTQMKDDSATIAQGAQAPRWKLPGRPPAGGELVFALDGNWAEGEAGTGAKLEEKAGEGALLSQGELQRATRDSVRALMMIRAYRMRGHLHADLDPLGIEPPKDHEELHPSAYGFTESDYTRKIFIDGVLGLKFATIPEMLNILRRTYCGTIGFEFMHISDPAEKSWLQRRIEGPGKEITFTKEGKRAILNKLVESEGFEHFLAIKYTGTKRFGLDGGEAMIPALEQIIKRGGALGVKDIVIGMAHRGRLNVLSQVMAKPHKAIFNEFKGGSFTP